MDQLLADEQLSPLQPGQGFDQSTPGNVVWPLPDNLGTIRDLATYDSNSGVTSIANHRVYDAYGNLTSQTNAAVDCVFGYTGKMLDNATGLQNNLNRWYDAKVGRWMSEDPIGLEAGDTNTYRYVGGSPANWIDPSGLKAGDKFRSRDDAARDWRATYHGLTAEDHRERGSTIYRTKDDQYTYSEAAVAEPKSPHEVEPSRPPEDDFNGVAGIVHSHTEQNAFSDWDYDRAEKIKEKVGHAIPEYLDTPKGDLLKMNLDNNKEPVTSIPLKPTIPPKSKRCAEKK